MLLQRLCQMYQRPPEVGCRLGLHVAQVVQRNRSWWLWGRPSGRLLGLPLKQQVVGRGWQVLGTRTGLLLCPRYNRRRRTALVQVARLQGQLIKNRCMLPTWLLLLDLQRKLTHP